MNADAANALLVTLRERNDVETLSLGGVSMWPMLRLAVLYHVISEVRGTGAAAPRGTAFRPGAGIDLSTRARPSHELRGRGCEDLGHAVGVDLPEPGADVLLVQSWRDFTAGTPDRPVDPLAEGLRRVDYEVATVAIPGRTALRSAQPDLALVQPLDRAPDFAPADVHAFVRQLRALLGELERMAGEPIVRVADCISYALRIVSTIAGWRSILGRLRPRSVMVQNYLNLERLALGAAARQLGVPLVDHQHGMFVRGAELYTSWIEVPDAVTDPMPSHFWVWSDWFARRLPDPTRGTGKVVGGDLRLYPGDPTAIHGMPNAERTILYLHQPIGQTRSGARIVDERVIDAVRRSPPGWHWLVRIHPRFKDRIGQARDELGSTSNVSIVEPTNATLEACLARADATVTGSSASAFEAIDAGVPTVFMDRVMTERMPGADADPLVVFAHGGDLIDVLAEPKRRPPRTVYVQRSIPLAERALASVLAGGGAMRPVEA